MHRLIVATVAALCLLCGPRALGQAPVTGTFNVGDERLVTMRGTKERIQVDGKPPQKTSIATDVQIKVLEAHEDHWIMEFTLRVPKATKISRAERAGIDAQRALFNVPMKVKLTTEGKMELVNLEQTREAVLAVVRQLKEKEAAAKGEEVREDAMQFVADMFADPEKANSLLLASYLPWFTHLGHELEDGKPVDEDVEMPSPFGDSMLAATRTLTMSAGTKGTRNFRAVVEFKPGEVKKMLSELFEKARRLAPKDKPPPDESELEKWKFEMKTSFRIVFDAASGWPRKVTSDNVTQVEIDGKGGTNRDRMECVFEEVPR